jgi:2-heptyl-3-hydroxy-4(1H)-quinolone synthase
MNQQRVLVVGGGIGGLAVAGLLSRLGVGVDLWERTPEWKPVGAGIMLAFNAMTVMKALGVDETLRARGMAFATGGVTTENGTFLANADMRPLAEKHGPSLAIHRAALHAVLVDAARDVRVKRGCTVDALTQDGDAAAATCSDGTTERYALVIGSDGIHSRVRELLFGNIPTRYSGYRCWRGVVADIPGVEGTVEMWGRGRRLGMVRVGEGQLYFFATLNAPARAEDPEAGRVKRFRENYGMFGGQAPALLASLSDDTPLIHGDIDEVWAPQWHKGNAVLLGDAAHAMTPNFGQGAAMALEDALILVQHLWAAPRISDALTAYAQERMPRVKAVQDGARQFGQLSQLENGLVRSMRDVVLKMTPTSTAIRSTEKMVGGAMASLKRGLPTGPVPAFFR